MPSRPSKIPSRTYDDLRAIAEDAIARYHPIRSTPVPIGEIIELQLKLDIIPTPGLRTGSDMYAMVSRDMKSIWIDADIQENRPQNYNYSLAHELAHIIIHKDVIEQFEYASIAEWKEVVTGIDADLYAGFEWQAHALAGLILVPIDALRTEFNEAASKIKAAGMTLAQAKSTEKGRFMVEDNLARQFVVPRSVITDRANRDGLWP